jgi:molybdopterin-guanine dinucleotide biosynthesis protein B
MLSSSVRWALMHELRGAAELTLDELVARMSPCDLLIVEGFKRQPIPKIEVFRAANGKVPLHPDDPHVVAIATDVRVDSPLPQFALDDVAQIADFVCVHNGLA